ncbi:MAG: CHAP domain-containing protein, partial [Candidatus Nanopelagicales bacterium]|nr:CHAP domain-containing protein [Candidatus Nanopelagicales bacterium]
MAAPDYSESTKLDPASKGGIGGGTEGRAMAVRQTLRRRSVWTAAAVFASVSMVGPAVAEPSPAEAHGELLVPRTATSQPCGAVVLSGGAWLSGGGVDVHSNGATQGGRSCGVLSVANRALQNGYGWQCVELAARLYHVKGWGIVYAGVNGGARYIPEGSPNLEFHPNGSGYMPVPGDLVVEAFGTYGHVTVVDQVDGANIHAIEQNAAWSGRKTYTWVSGVASGAYNGGVVRGFMHAPLNTSTNAGNGTSAVKLSSPPTSARGKVARRKLVIRWGPPPGQAVTGFKIQLRRRD